MTIEITHYAAGRDFYIQDDMSDTEYREYVTAYANAVRKAVETDYPESTVDSEIDWNQASMQSMTVGILGPERENEDDLVDGIRQIAERIWGDQSFEPAAI